MKQIFYYERVDTDIELNIGNWLLVVGSRVIVLTLLKMIARLVETGTVREVDCGNVFDIFLAGCGTRGGLDVLDRIKVSEAFICYQILAVLESLETGRALRITTTTLQLPE